MDTAKKAKLYRWIVYCAMFFLVLTSAIRFAIGEWEIAVCELFLLFICVLLLRRAKR